MQKLGAHALGHLAPVDRRRAPPPLRRGGGGHMGVHVDGQDEQDQS
ncbi:MAG: hypothetical protein LC800_11830 [Acidobacteria bacterium]|nr:hypothetical protein [Acidobacteriota bacterium]